MINATSTDAGFTFAGAETGTTYSYTVTSSGGTGSVTGSGSVTSATQQVSGIERLLAGRRHPDLQRHLDRRGRQYGTAATATATLDTVAPAAIRSRPTRPDQRQPGRPRRGFTFAGAETGTTYSYTVTSSGGDRGDRQRQRDLGHAERHRRSTSPRCPTAR